MDRRCFCPPESLTPRSPDDRLVALAQVHNELVRIGSPGGRHQLGFARLRVAKQQVLAHRPVEQEYIL